MYLNLLKRPHKHDKVSGQHLFSANAWFEIKQMRLIFTNLKLWVAVARHNFKWVKI